MSKRFETGIEVIGWIRIVLSPLLIGLFIGVIVYVNMPDLIGFVIALGLVVIGLVIGIVWANRIWKKHGTEHYLSRLYSSPDLDPKPEDPNQKNNIENDHKS